MAAGTDDSICPWLEGRSARECARGYLSECLLRSPREEEVREFRLHTDSTRPWASGSGGGDWILKSFSTPGAASSTNSPASLFRDSGSGEWGVHAVGSSGVGTLFCRSPNLPSLGARRERLACGILPFAGAALGLEPVANCPDNGTRFVKLHRSNLVCYPNLISYGP